MENNEQDKYIHDHSADKFFGIVGAFLIVVGACVALYDVAHSPMWSGIAGLTFMLVGGTCAMIAVGGFLKYLDEKHF